MPVAGATDESGPRQWMTRSRSPADYTQSPEAPACGCSCYRHHCDNANSTRCNGFRYNVRPRPHACSCRTDSNSCRSHEGPALPIGTKIAEQQPPCHRRHLQALNAAEPITMASGTGTYSGERTPPETAPGPPSCPMGEGCGSANCIMANSIRPKRLCICMVSDFFFPSLGGVEMHIYELSVRLARKGKPVRAICITAKQNCMRLHIDKLLVTRSSCCPSIS